VIALFVAALFDYRYLEMFAQIIFVGFLLSLVAVYLFGETQGSGSQRWISVAGVLVQPTELGKFLLIVFLAWYLSRYYGESKSFTALLIGLVLLAAPMVLVFLQPDLGMTITLAFIGGVIILVSGMKFSHFAILGSVLVLGIVGLFLVSQAGLMEVNILQGYMLERIQIFLDPNSDPDAAFNVRQALISVGAGGWLGQGWQLGSQSQLFFLRVRHTDFIFSVIAEELGLIGSSILLSLFFIVIWRLLRIVERARDDFGRLIAVGVAALIFFQVFINVGMNMSIVPVTGMTLPFVSYGGSSLVSLMLAVGLAESVAMRHRKMDFS
jgi:rod shape determining protein RodA